MEYVAFRDPDHGNFGDDLNRWLWPRLLGHATADDALFLGIGTILFPGNPILRGADTKRKIVFGTGVRPTHRPFALDTTWDVRFVRGPLSAAALTRDADFISDAAYALPLAADFESLIEPKRYKVSVMPYFRSVGYFDWNDICATLGYHYISPLAEDGVERTIREISASETLITESLHGAIVADILRVPWRRFILSTPVTEGEYVSEFKWNDWLLSVGINNHEADFIPMFTRGRKVISQVTSKYVDAQFFLRRRVTADLLSQLGTAERSYLSAEKRLDEVVTAIGVKLEGLRRDLAE